ncbi:MAG: hypothetical protein H6578_03485 [Chitinophagales bacterium]|nr:hypothetical protein [Chitinophagales bacterium]
MGFLTTANILFAQQEETYYYYYKDEPTTFIPIDSSLNNLEEYNFVQSNTWDYFNLGNTGQAHYKLALDWDNKIGFKNGMTHFDRYKYAMDRIKYYNTKKPYSEISYTIGSKRENIFGAKFSHNIKNRFVYGLEFHRTLSNGVYRNMPSKNGAFTLYGLFTSKNARYQLGVDLVFNKIKNEENGGVQEDFVNTPSLKESNKEFYTPYITQGLTQHKNLNLLITNTYNFGFHKIDSINDSLSVKKFYPSFSINYKVGTQRNTFQFVDKAADSVNYYNDYLNFYQVEDSTYYRLYYHQIPNQVSVSYSGLKKNTDSIQYFNFRAEAGVQHDNIELWQNRKEMTTNNLHVFGLIQSNEFSNKKWQYKAEGYYYLTGYNQNDWKVNGYFAYDFGKWGYAKASGSVEQQEASWIENSYYSTSKTWENNFKKKSKATVALDYHIPKLKLKLHGEYDILGNYIYFNQNSEPTQLNGALQYWQLTVNSELNYKILHFDNFVGVQGSSRKDILRIPTVFLQSSLYVQGKLFKKKMQAWFGVKLTYNTNFSAYAWNPLIGQFYLQDQQTMHYTPRLDAFLSFKVKTLRVFVTANYLNEGLIKKNYYTALHYPDRGRIFAGGLVWRFFE